MKGCRRLKTSARTVFQALTHNARVDCQTLYARHKDGEYTGLQLSGLQRLKVKTYRYTTAHRVGKSAPRSVKHAGSWSEPC